MISIDLKFGIGKNGLEFSKNYKSLIQDASQLVIQAFLNPEFEKKVLKYNWKPRLGKRKFGFKHTSVSRKDIFNRIISGDDKFMEEFPNDSNTKGDKDLDIWIIPYYDKKNTNVVGKTNNKTYLTWLNLSHWDSKVNSCLEGSYDYELLKIALAKNIAHEYCHNLGFQHKGNNSKRNNNRHSVPYAIGDIVKKLLLKELKEKVIKKKKVDNLVTDYTYLKTIEPTCSFEDEEYVA